MPLASKYITQPSLQWYRLDNAAKLYTAITKENHTSVFRVSLDSSAPIDPALLQQALEDIINRFPTFRVRLKRGLFWYYLEENPYLPAVEPDVVCPCERFSSKKNHGYLFRVRYRENRIALECFHSITDGTGASIFLKTLYAQYLRLLGIDIPCEKGVLDPHSAPDIRELEDDFLHYAKKSQISRPKEQRAYQVGGQHLPSHSLGVICGILPADQVLVLAHEAGLSLTEYLASVLLHTFFRHQKASGKQKKRPCVVSVPINMRQFLKSISMRNFSLFVNPRLDPRYGDYSFEETLQLVHHFMQYEINEKFLLAQMAANVASERNIFVRILPLFLKNLAISLVYQCVGENRASTTLSNLGRIEVPGQMRPYIRRFEMLLGPSEINATKAAVCTLNNQLIINFSRTVVPADVEREFFRFFIRRGVPVKVESNQ